MGKRALREVGNSEGGRGDGALDKCPLHDSVAQRRRHISHIPTREPVTQGAGLSAGEAVPVSPCLVASKKRWTSDLEETPRHLFWEGWRSLARVVEASTALIASSSR